MDIDLKSIPEDTTPQPEKTDELLQFEFKIIKEKKREQRNKLLIESDKYLLPDYPISVSNLILIKNYRQQLRDCMKNDIIQIPEFPLFPL